MNQKIRSMFHRIGDNKGFTLVEMALVLIIIGIIIGAIVKGKDLVRGSEQKRIFTKYINAWRLGYLNFYDRTGQILGDTWNTVAAPAAAGQDGQADTSAGTGTAATAAGRDALVARGAGVTAYRGLEDAGLEAPVTNRPVAYEYNYVDSEGGNHTMQIAFLYETVAPTYNYMEVTQIPNELAMAMDRMIDGQANGTDGDFINADGTNDWGAPTAAVTARWRMQF